MNFYNSFNEMFSAQSSVKNDMCVFNINANDIILSIIDQLKECENDIILIRKRTQLAYNKFMKVVEKNDIDVDDLTYEDFAENIPLIDLMRDCHKPYNALVKKIKGIYDDILDLNVKY